MSRRLLLVLALPFVLAVEPAGGASPAPSPPPSWEGRPAWASPVGGGVARAYDYDAAAPFARGAHRGVDLATRPGARVGAPCAGAVTHAGRVPGHDRGVTIACGALVATVLDLRATAVAKGQRVGRSARLGAASGATLHLGARRAAHRFAYVEPPIAPSADPPPFGPAPAPAPVRAPRRRRVGAPVRAARAAPRAEPRAEPRGVPVPAWAGLALLAGALPLGALTWRRQRALRRVLADA